MNDNLDSTLDASDFFVVSGTMRHSSRSYVERPADDELFRRAKEREYCYVLTARQMGKSSLMVKTAKRLKAEGIGAAIIDLTQLGQNIAIDAWYIGILNRICGQLQLRHLNTEQWWQNHTHLSAVQRFTDFLYQEILTSTDQPVVIFIDEIDLTLNLDFSDDFFAAIRAMYNSRASNPLFGRLTFILLGVATPSDLIKDRRRTPFNIGHQIDLNEFDRNNAVILQQGLDAFYPGQGKSLLDRIFYWTNGHPYLTQNLCHEIATSKQKTWTNHDIDRLVQETFLSKEGQKESNLQHIRNYIITHPLNQELLKLYRDVFRGKKIQLNEQSSTQNQLKLIGILKPSRGILAVRNEIYRRVFDEHWLKENIEINWYRRLTIISLIGVICLLFIIGGFAWQQSQKLRNLKVQEAIVNFSQLSSEDQQTLFKNSPAELKPYLPTIAASVYTSLENTEENNQLLQVIQSTLTSYTDEESQLLVRILTLWQAGRSAAAQENWEEALANYNAALDLVETNPGLTYDRAIAYLAQGDFEATLADFETISNLELSDREISQWQSHIQQIMRDNQALNAYWWQERENFTNLVAYVSTPTNTPTPTLTPPPSATPTVTGTPTPTPTQTPLAPIEIFWRYQGGEATFSPNGRFIITTKDSAVPSLWNGFTGELITSLYPGKTQSHWNPSEIFSPDDTRIVTTGLENELVLWNSSSGEVVASLPHTGLSLFEIAFSPDSSRLATHNYGDNTYIWDAQDGSLIRTLPGIFLSFSPDGTRLVTGGREQMARLWDFSTGNLISILDEADDAMSAAKFSPNGEQLVTQAINSSNLFLWNGLTGEFTATIAGSISSHFLDFGPPISFTTDSSRIFTSGHLWNAQTGELIATLDSDSIYGEFSLDGSRLITWRERERPTLWEGRLGIRIEELFTSAIPGIPPIFSPDGTKIVLGTDESPSDGFSEVHLWSSETGEEISFQRDGLRGDITVTKFSPDGGYYLTAGKDGQVIFWNADTGNLIARLQPHDRIVDSATFSADGMRLITTSGENVYLWDITAILRQLRQQD